MKKGDFKLQMSCHLNTSLHTVFDSSKFGLGQRLGVPYMRAQQDRVLVNVDGTTLSLRQSVAGVSAISGVVWDAGLYLVDFLVSDSKSQSQILHRLDGQRVLDLGCGTGICGVAAYLLGAHSVLLSDSVDSDYLQENVECAKQMKAMLSSNTSNTSSSSSSSSVCAPTISFVPYDWSVELLPSELTGAPMSVGVTFTALTLGNESSATATASISTATATISTATSASSTEEPHRKNECCWDWDTILCSDVLYDAKAHAPLLRCLRRLRFHRLVLSYKRRHDEPEKLFFKELEDFCDITVVPDEQIELINVSATNRMGLFIFIITLKSAPL